MRLSQSMRALSRHAGSASRVSLSSAGPLMSSFHAATLWNTMERSKLKYGARGLNATAGHRSAPLAWMRWWASHSAGRWSASRTFMGMPG